MIFGEIYLGNAVIKEKIMNKRFMKYILMILFLLCVPSLYIYSQYLDTIKADAEEGAYYYVTDGYSIFTAINIDDWMQDESISSSQLLKESRFIEAAQQLEGLLEEELSNEREAVVLNNLGIAYACAGDYKKSENILKEALLKASRWEVSINNNLGAVYGNLGELDAASEYFGQLPQDEGIDNRKLELAIKSNKVLLLEYETESNWKTIIEEEKEIYGRKGLISAVIYLNMADFTMEIQNDPSNANRYVQKARSINRRWLDNPVIEIQICGFRAETCSRFGTYEKGEKQILTAKTKLEELGIEKCAAASEIYRKSGLLKKNSKNYAVAMEEYEKALSMISAGSPKAFLICYDISNIYVIQEDSEEAMDWRVRAYNIYNGLNEIQRDERWERKILYDLSVLYNREIFSRNRVGNFNQWLDDKSYELLEGDIVIYEDYYYITDGYGIYAVVGTDDWDQPAYVKSNTLMQEAKFDEAVIQLENLLGINNLSDAYKAIVSNNLGVAYACSGDYMSADLMLKRASSNCHKWDNAINNNLGVISGYTKHEDQTFNYFQPLLENKDVKNSFFGAVVRSNLFSNSKNDKMVLIEKEKKYLGRYELVSAINNLGIVVDVLYNVMNIKDGSAVVNEYLNQAESINNSVLNNPIIQVRICEMRAIDSQINENDKERERQIKEALRLLENFGLEKTIVAKDIYSQWIAIQKNKGNYTQAYQETLKALELIIKLQPDQLEHIYSMIDSIAELQNNVDEAVVWKLRAYKLFQNLNDSEDEISLKNKVKEDLLTIYEQEGYKDKYGRTFEEWLKEALEKVPEEGI